MIKKLVKEFAEILKIKDRDGKSFKNYSPGIGSFDEKGHLDYLTKYSSIKINREIEYPNQREKCDLQLDLGSRSMYLEFKLCRPYQNNGVIDKLFYKTVFSPFDKNTLMTDIIKLKNSGFNGDKAIMFVYYGRKNEENQLLNLNNIISKIIIDTQYWYEIKLELLTKEEFFDLIHPIHNYGALVILRIGE